MVSNVRMPIKQDAPRQLKELGLDKIQAWGINTFLTFQVFSQVRSNSDKLDQWFQMLEARCSLSVERAGTRQNSSLGSFLRS